MTEAQKGNVKPIFNPKEFISMKELNQLSQLSSWKSSRDIFFQYFAIISSISLAIYFNNIWLTIITVIFVGARYYALGMMLHEGLHYRLSNNRKRNEFIMKYFLAIPLFINPKVFRHNHLNHHQHLHTHDDPEFSRKGNKIWEFPMKPVKLFFLLLYDITGLSLPFMIFSHKGYVVTKETNQKKKKDFSRMIIYGIIFSLLTYFGLWKYAFLFWILPLLTWGNFLIRLRRISEHCGIMVNEELISRSRTTIANMWERIFIAPCNINFHNEHHLYPSVPYYNLPKLHEVLMSNESYRNKIHITYGYKNVIRECLV